jgi:hypothetical protein
MEDSTAVAIAPWALLDESSGKLTTIKVWSCCKSLRSILNKYERISIKLRMSSLTLSSGLKFLSHCETKSKTCLPIGCFSFLKDQ